MTRRAGKPALIVALSALLLAAAVGGRAKVQVGRLIGVHISSPQTYISGTGTVGADNTAQTVLTVSLPANTLTQVGDRARIRTYWSANAGTPITGSTTVNGVLTADQLHTGGASLNLTECWLHYIDATHANVIEEDAAGLGANSAANVAGFNWAAAQDIDFDQSAALSTHLVLFALIIDVFPKGYAN